MNIDQLIAHRGASAYAPENTLAALAMAKQQGATWVEFDVQLTKDKKVVIAHDDKLNRVSNGAGLLCDKTLAELQQLDFGGWFSSEYKNEKIPTLRQWLQFSAQLDLNLNLELKELPFGDSDVLIEKTLAEIDLFWPNTEGLLVSSFDWHCLRQFHQAEPAIKTAVLAHDWDDDSAIALANELKSVSINVNLDVVTPQIIEKIKMAGFQMLVYTVNDVEEAQRLFAMGVDGVFSDDPLLLNRRN